MKEDDKYYAKLVLMARDGVIQRNEVEEMLCGCNNAEIWTFLHLSLLPEIYVDSKEDKELTELCNKYETSEVLATEVW